MRRVLVGSFVALAFMSFASPAWAHHPSIMASTACADGAHVVEAVVAHQAKQPMTIVSLVGVINDVTYQFGGYSSPVDPGGMTGAVTTVPGDVTGTVTLTASLSWPNFAKTVTATVELEGPCVVVTTTTAATTTSTAPSVPPTSAVPCDQTPQCLPNTGGDPVPLTVVGLGLAGTGALLAAGFRLSRKKA